MAKINLSPKHQALNQLGALNSAAEKVSDELFLNQEFFDSSDLVQVKYEMLRRVRVDGVTVSQAAYELGFSRTAFYQALAVFQEQGLPGLIPKRPGPKTAHKLSEAVLEFIELQQQEAAPKALRSEVLAELVSREFNFTIHPRSVERAMANRRKKND